jgi:GMP synthase (glutamine-hydrolysing)
MREQEVRCFARALGCGQQQIEVFDLLGGAPSIRQLGNFDVVLLGGSGDYSVASGGSWLSPALAAMRELYDLGKPTFASCWGFQAMARALGGEVVTDVARAELGTVKVRVTPAGQQDPLFATLGDDFLAQMGHQDVVVRLPRGAILLASTERVENQAFRFPDKPIYCTQFHPELDRAALIQRVEAYPWYVEQVARTSLDDFSAHHCHETPQARTLLRRFVETIVELENCKK